MTTAELLEKYKIKPSLQRLAVMDYLMSHKTHPTVDEIYDDLVSKMPTLSRTTIYNTLKLFVEKGVTLELLIDEKSLRYDGDISNHAHFICQKCGRIFDFFPSQIEPLKSVCITNCEGFLIKETQVYYKGLCKDCNCSNIC